MTNYSDREPREQFVSIESVRVNPKKLRKLSSAKVEYYAECFEIGDNFLPLEVLDCGGFYTVHDGRHRYLAQLRNGYRFVAVTIV